MYRIMSVALVLCSDAYAWLSQQSVALPEQDIKLLGLLLTGSTGQHWLARDLGWAGGSHCASLGQVLEYAVGA